MDWKKRTIALTGVLLLLGCASTITNDPRTTKKEATAKRSKILSDICEIEKKYSVYATSTINIGNGNTIDGDVYASTNVQLPYNTVWSAVATPLVDRVVESYTGPGTCKKQTRDMWGNPFWVVQYFPDCPIQDVYEVDDVYGLGQSSSESDAKRLALENCDNSVERLMAQYEDLEFHVDKLRCTVAKVQRCS